MDSSNKVQYVIELLQQGDTARAREELDKVGKSAESAGKSFEKLQGSAEELLAVFGAEFTLRKSLNAFEEAERVNAKLASSLLSTKQNTAEMRGEIEALTEQLKEMTAFSGPEITNVIAKLVALGATKDSIRPLTEAVLDFSTLVDKDLNRSVTAMGRAMKGEFSTFTDLGFKFNELQSTGQKVNSLLEQIGKTAGGQAKAGAETLGGEMERLQKRLEETKVTLGAWIAKAVSGFDSLFEKWGEGMQMPVVQERLQLLAKEHEGLRASLEHELTLMQQMEQLAGTDLTGTGRAAVGPPVAPFLKQQLAAGFADDDVNRETAALDFVRAQLGRSSSAPVAGKSTFDHANAEEEKKALEDLSKLRLEMAKATLTEFNQERAAAEENYNDRALQIVKLTNEGRLSSDERAQAEKENERELAVEKERIDVREQQRKDQISVKEMENARRLAALEADLSDQKVAAQLRGEELIQFQMAARHDQRIRAIEQEHFDDIEQYTDVMTAEAELYAAEQARYRAEHSFAEGFKLDLVEIGKQGEQSFAQGLAGAMVDAFSEGDKAFQKFASNFLKQIAQMILQAIILRAIQSVFGGGGQALGNPSSSQVSAGAAKLSAAGGFYPIMAAGGIQMVDQATFLPQFNVIAGEAGRELLTVFANPSSGRFMGMQAQFGNVGPSRMALVNMSPRRMADGGSAGFTTQPGNGATGATASMGGSATVEVTLSPGLEARIVKQAIDGAVVQVTRQLGRDGPLASAARKLTA